MDKLFEDWRKYLLVEFKGDPVDYAPEPPEEEEEEAYSNIAAAARFFKFFFSCT